VSSGLHAVDFVEQHRAIVEQRLLEAGIDNAPGEAMTLLHLVLAHRIIGNTERLDVLLEAAVQEREAHRSLARIAGFKHFHGLALRLDDAVYEPCASSERLLDHALACVDDHENPLRILDLGTGTGNLLLAALKAMPSATGIGIDRNPAAVSLARENAVAHQLDGRCEFVIGDAHKADLAGFDVILSTLPWVPTAKLNALRPEVRLYDPADALDGGRDGLDHFRALAKSLNRMLTSGGNAFLQIGYEHVNDARALFARAGHTDIDILRDGYGFPIGLRVGA
jgi:release factor glutamine methyltransferase